MRRVVCLPILGSLALFAQGAPGDLDTRFGSAGVLQWHLGGDEQARGIVLLPDGRSILAGYSNKNGNSDFLLARLTEAGQPDPSFGNGGLILTEMTSGNDQAHAVVSQSDGKLVLAGYAAPSGNADISIARFHPNGSLDSSFNGSGKLIFSLSTGDDYIQAIGIDPDNRLVVAGYSHPLETGATADVALARILPDGTPDTAFNNAVRIVVANTPGAQIARAVVPLADGGIIIGGEMTNGATTDFFVAKFTASGTLDTAFGTNGFVITDIGGGDDTAGAMKVMADGKIVLSGSARVSGSSNFAIARYTPTGSLDPSFNGSGILNTDIITNGDDYATGITVQGDGKIVLCGRSSGNFALARYLTNGALDTSFNLNGRLRSALLGHGTHAHAVAIRGDGSIIAAGFATPGSSGDLASWKCLPNGTLDPTYGGTGRTTTSFGSLNDECYALALQPLDQKIVAVGVSNNSTNRDFAVARYTREGMLDSTFSGDGMVTTAIGTSHDDASCVAIQADGKIVVGGHSFNAANGFDFCLVRLTSNGSPDNFFGSGGKVTTKVGKDASDDYMRAMVIQPSDGKIITVGAAVPDGGTNNDFHVVRYLDSGVLDSSFGTSSLKGLAWVGFGATHDEATCVALQSDGKILIGGYVDGTGGHDFAIARLNANGALDSSFNGNSKVVTHAGGDDFAQAITVLPDGKILLCGFTVVSGVTYSMTTVRYHSDGSLDTSFGIAGIATNSYDMAFDLVRQNDGNFILAGQNHNGVNEDFAIARYIPGGSLDSTFGLAGRATTVIGPGHDRAYGAVVQKDGKIVLGGHSHDGTRQRFSLVRYHGNTPAPITGASDFITRTSAVINGAVNPNGIETIVYFEYGTSSSYGSTTAQQSVGNGSSVVTVNPATLTNLQPNTTYRYRLVAYNGTDYLNGVERTFTTAADPPEAITGIADDKTATAATLVGAVKSYGLPFSVKFQYGETAAYGLETVAENWPGSNITETIRLPIAGLVEGREYHFRIVASTAWGTGFGSDQVFTAQSGSPPTGPPIAITEGATVTGARGALVSGSVNPNSGGTSVWMQYGLSEAYGSTTAKPDVGNGNAPVGVSFALAGLEPGTLYHFRTVAQNVRGTSFGVDQTFRTDFLPPIIGEKRAIPHGTSGVQIQGAVSGSGDSAKVYVDYRPVDGIWTTVEASAVSGYGTNNVSAILEGLAQGIEYEYLIRSKNSGGETIGDSGTFRLEVLLGLTRVHPGPPPESEGSLYVILKPDGLDHGWRFVGEEFWRQSGRTVGSLATGDRLVEFRPVRDHITPPVESITVNSGAATTLLERHYFTTDAGGSGGLSVTLKPDSLTSGPDRAQWRLVGEGDEEWRNSGEIRSNLPPGTHVIECKPVPGRTTPHNTSIQVAAGTTSVPILTYLEAATFNGMEPVPLAFETVAQEPYTYIGQLRGSAGSGTGFVIKKRVVATAAHVVWDEGTLAPATRLEWLFQRHAGIHEPRPQTPRGFYVLTGYDEQRERESSPGSFSPQSRNRDVAALYFTEDAARGGYGGFLASDLENNEFLLSDANKILAGYPLNGVAAASRGRVHATSPSNVRFDRVPFTPYDAPDEPRRIFLTTDIRSSGGASGGPLLVQFEGGHYYPAAIYLGGSTQSIVRAIDGRVIDLFDLAEESGIDGEPHTGGGITHTGVSAIGSAADPGALEVNLAPAGAIAAGAGWRLRPETSYRNNGAQQGGLNAGRYTLELAPVPGFQTPAPQSILIKGGQLKTLTFTYAGVPVPAAAITLRGNNRAISNGDSSPSPLDGSDFGLTAVDGGTTTRSFTVSNPGTAPLSLGSVLLGGSHADDFSLSIRPGDSIPAGGSTTFTVLFDPSAPGTRSATVSFATNVSGTNPFSFAIQGNDTTDSDSNGFTDLEEAALATLLASFTVGQTIDLDLSFLRLGTGQVLELLNLPPGLGFDPDTRRITGRINAKPASPQFEIRKRDGATVAATLTRTFPVFTPPTLAISGLRRFPATRIGRRSRPQTVRVTNAGELPLTRLSVKTTGRAARDFLVTQPAETTLAANAATSFTVTFRPRSKGTRPASITVLSNTAPRSVPVSGTGK